MNCKDYTEIVGILFGISKELSQKLVLGTPNEILQLQADLNQKSAEYLLKEIGSEFEFAKKTVGNGYFFGPKEISQTFLEEVKIEESDIPPIPFSFYELKLARLCGLSLVLRVHNDKEGRSLSMSRIREIFGGMTESRNPYYEQRDFFKKEESGCWRAAKDQGIEIDDSAACQSEGINHWELVPIEEPNVFNQEGKKRAELESMFLQMVRSRIMRCKEGKKASPTGLEEFVELYSKVYKGSEIKWPEIHNLGFGWDDYFDRPPVEILYDLVVTKAKSACGQSRHRVGTDNSCFVRLDLTDKRVGIGDCCAQNVELTMPKFEEMIAKTNSAQ